MDRSEIQKCQLPNTSIDGSPFLNIKNSRLRKKKTQSKLTYLKEVSTKKNKNDYSKMSENESKGKSETKSKENSSLMLSEEPPSCGDVTSENKSNQGKAVYACPVCWKQFENAGDQMQHMKTCAAKHNLTLKQLLDALDLQTKQIEERKTLGLPCVPATSIVRKSFSKKNSSVTDRDDPDLQLGLALSVSMRESEEQNHLAEQEIMLEAGLGDEVAANQASLLERFGFTSTRPVLPSMYPRARLGKAKLKGTPLLLVRTQDERERLITEKVAIILTSEENQHPIPHSEGDQETHPKSRYLQSETLVQLQNGECYLWKKASASPNPKDSHIYYVDSLSYVISPSTMRAGSKLKHLSQVPCRVKTPEKYAQTAVENRSLNQIGEYSNKFTISAQVNLDQQMNRDKNLFSIDGESEYQEKIMTSVTSSTKIQGKLNQFVSKFTGDWNKLLNNRHMSDIQIRLEDGEEIYVHELVLFVRCPNILQDVKQVNDSFKCIIWNEISRKCALAFLDFIYSGSTCKIDELEYVDEVILLSTKYCVEDLCCYLNCVMSDGKNDVIERQEVNRVSPEESSRIAKVYTSELHNAHISDVHLMTACKSQTERLVVSEENTSKNKEKYMENNCETGDQALFVNSPENKVSFSESCISPDPFVDSCDQEISNTYCTRKSFSLNTQQNMDKLLEALGSDEEDELHQIYSNCSNRDSPQLPGTCTFLKESPEVEIVDAQNNEILELSTIKKRKLSDNCKSLDSKQICMNDRNSVRKSLLLHFSDEGENSLPNEKDEVTIVWNQNNCKSNLVSSDELVEKVLVDNSIHNSAETLNINCREALHEVGNTNVQSLTDDVLIIQSSPSTSDKLSDTHDQVADSSTDLLGDFCADYEYQNLYANYTPDDKNKLHSKYDAEKSLNSSSPMKNNSCEVNDTQDKSKSPFSSPLSVKSLSLRKSVNNSTPKKHTFFEVNDSEDQSKSPFSSPLSVKSLSRVDSPTVFEKNRNSRKKLTKTRSSSDISLNSDASPISIKCLSQSSIHLKSSHDVNAEINKMNSVSAIESDIVKTSVSSESPVMPSTLVQGTPNRSLSSVKRLLEDSFTADLERNLLEKKLDCEGWPCSTPNSRQSKTSVLSKHLQNVKTGDNCVTPMADYSGMDTPMLKRELQKYGLKPLKRKRAKQILRHIYNELHPLVPVHSIHDITEDVNPQDDLLPMSCAVKQTDEIPNQKKQHKKKSKTQNIGVANNSTEEAENSSGNEVSFASTQDSSSSSQCEFEVLEDPTDDAALTQTDVSELPIVVHNYITTNPEFHQQVLLYEPIWIEQLQEGLKAQNYKYKLSQLMEYLDEECITFRTNQGKKPKNRQKKKSSK